MEQPDSTDVNKNFFAEPNSQMAYVLGLAMGGGHIGNKNGQEFLSIRSIEKGQLEMVNIWMKSKYKVCDSGESEAGHTVWCLEVDNERVVTDAKRWGVNPPSTYLSKLPELPMEYHADFTRGLFSRIAVAAERNLFDEQGSKV